jgi:tetratricopeptide (TPR) repeat protein
MAIRPFRYCLALACLGCLPVFALPQSPEQMTLEQQRAALLWQKGQDAMRHGQPTDAVRCYQQSLALDPALTRNYLSLAAACVETGDDDAACQHLRRYVQANPDQLGIRLHLADLELRLKHWPEARREFDRCVRCAQEGTGSAEDELLHCHARLMEVAEAVEDYYEEHLHRGIGLCILARQRATLSDPEGEMSTESILCKAAGELTLAQNDRPGLARPNWYLYSVWSMLDQKSAATRCLRQAAESAPFTGDLTTAELRQMRCQSRCVSVEVQKR